MQADTEVAEAKVREAEVTVAVVAVEEVVAAEAEAEEAAAAVVTEAVVVMVAEAVMEKVGGGGKEVRARTVIVAGDITSRVGIRISVKDLDGTELELWEDILRNADKYFRMVEEETILNRCFDNSNKQVKSSVKLDNCQRRKWTHGASWQYDVVYPIDVCDHKQDETKQICDQDVKQYVFRPDSNAPDTDFNTTEEVEFIVTNLRNILCVSHMDAACAKSKNLPQGRTDREELIVCVAEIMMIATFHKSIDVLEKRTHNVRVALESGESESRKSVSPAQEACR
ncbi:hypothetical protein CYMTET_47670 [Cymbomonas tetramitiformis]|uniref:Uncharacterized protein n=1 Tax=Cymbomonas tetramitiformis TaxID=36881 RepID=A0AAE0EWH6_9CHLO|nr:hypothetical protein CYMTET_47670 [Cymbomonas tetramitiformis]